MPKELDPVDERQAFKQPEMELEPIPRAGDEKAVADEKDTFGELRSDDAGRRSGHRG